MENYAKKKKVEIHENATRKPKVETDLEVTGVSRSGRVRKKSSKLMDFESPDDIEAKIRKPAKTMGGNYRTTSETELDYGVVHSTNKLELDVAEGGSGSEDDFYDGNMDTADSIDSMDSEDAPSDNESSMQPSADTSGTSLGLSAPSHSLYMMEKSTKKKLIVKDGKVVGRAKAQRKDKGKSRVTAYMLWAREARNELLRKCPEMEFTSVAKRLGEMWANVNYQERYVWKRKAKRFAMKKGGAESLGAKIVTTSGTGGVNNQVVVTQPRVRQSSGQGKQIVSPTSQPHGGGVFRVTGCGPAEVAAHLLLLGESLAIIGERLKEHEGQIAVSGSVSVLLDTLLCSLAPLLCLTAHIPGVTLPEHLMKDTFDNIAFIMPGL